MIGEDIDRAVPDVRVVLKLHFHSGRPPVALILPSPHADDRFRCASHQPYPL